MISSALRDRAVRTLAMAAKRKTFYRRVLPDVCTAFASERGKQLFKDALSTGCMNCYFPLASQFRTQEEPAYCGLSSLVMVLNALAIDPGVVWKGVFRWYHEDMLDCCTSLEEIKEKGVSMDSLMCLALCNQLEGELKRVSESSCITQFREEVKYATSKEDRAIIVSYGRKVLNQTGSGHFSPIAGYNLMEDMVLILDVARFKYPPYWVPLTELWKAMKTLDEDTGLYRGYMTLWRADNKIMPSQPPLLFKVSQRLNASNPIVRNSGSFLRKVKSFLLEKATEKTEEESFKNVLVRFLDESYKHANINKDGDSPNLLSLRITEEQLQTLIPEQKEVIDQLIQAINETPLCKKIEEIFPKGICCQQALFTTQDIDSELKVCMKGESCVICLQHFLTVFLLSFPMDNVTCCHDSHDKVDKSETDRHNYSESIKGTYYSVVKKLVEAELGQDTCGKCGYSKSPGKLRHDLLMNEVTQLRRQFTALMNIDSP